MTIIGGVRFHLRQSLAIDENPVKAHGYLVKWGTFLFHKFSERDEMQKWYTALLDETAKKGIPFTPLEVIYNGQRCGFYADIECYIPLDKLDSSPEEIKSLKEDIIQNTRQAYAARGLDPDALLWLENHRRDLSKEKYKISFHAIGRDVDFEGTDKDSSLCHTAKKITRDLKFLATKYCFVVFSKCNYTDTHDNVLDLDVYSNNRAMRGPYASKNNSPGSRLLPCKGYEGLPLSAWWIVRDVDSYKSRKVHIEPWTPNDEESMQQNKNTSKRKTISNTMAKNPRNKKSTKAKGDSSEESLSEEWKDVIPRTVDRLGSYFRALQNDKTIHAKHTGFCEDRPTYRIDGKLRACKMCHKEHDSNGTSIQDIGEGFFLARCFGAIRSMSIKIFLQDREHPPSENIPADVSETEDNRVPSILNIPEKCILVTAGMGSGKTYRVEELIRENPGKSVLYIACRVSMARSISGRFKYLGFGIYNDPDSIDERYRVLWEYESLHKVSKTCDILVIDEARAIMSAATTYETNKNNLCANFQKLVFLARECKKLVVMCADSNVDGCVEEFVQEVFRPDRPSAMTDYFLRERDLVHALGRPTSTEDFFKGRKDKDIHYIKLSKPILKRTFVITKPLETIDMMVRDLSEGKRVVGWFGSSKLMKATMANAREKLPHISTTMYHAESENKAHLVNMDVAFDFDFVAYTSCITVALDSTRPVHRVYVFPHVLTSSPRDMLQSSGRARNVETNEVIVSLPATKKTKEGYAPSVAYGPLEPDFDIELEQKKHIEFITRKRTVTTALLDAIKSTMHMVNVDSEIKQMPSALMRIWAYNRAEETMKSTFWYNIFLWLVEKKGYEWRMTESSTEGGLEDFPHDLGNFFKESPKSIRDKEIEEMMCIDVYHLDPSWEHDTKLNTYAGTASRTEMLALRKYRLQEPFKHELSEDDLRTLLTKKRQVYNVVSLLQLTEESRAKRCVTNMSVAEKDFVRVDYLVMNKLESVLKYLGYEGFMDRSTAVNLLDKIDDHVKDELSQLKTLTTGTRVGTVSSKTELSMYLDKYLGIKIPNRKIGPRDGRVRMYRIAEDDAVWRLARSPNTCMYTKT